ncbi:uncharacterized protein C13orf42 [Lampris incognitus]|uniref:uncharacterized protein C13orf42 n=1 Tax=Lampris incognitus TaxID=2546036 RepID=UPI0024B51DDC|nr:uncharacterized protein C13orf42 [Lampris incognitus]
MFRKINNVFRPNQQGHKAGDGRYRSEQDYHNACTVRLVRSTSMLVIGEKAQVDQVNSPLKRSQSSVSIESTAALYYYQRQEDRIWLYSQNQNCLEYLEELVALRRQYTRSVNNLTSNEAEATLSSRKKPAPPPPTKDAQISRAKPSAPPVPSEEDTLQFLDAVIASCDSESVHKPHVDDGHADVDFIVATSSSDHDLHSNWVLRVPRLTNGSGQKAFHESAKDCIPKKKTSGGSTSSRLRLQRNPIHLPKVVQSAFQTLRFKPKLKKQGPKTKHFEPPS